MNSIKNIIIAITSFGLIVLLAGASAYAAESQGTNYYHRGYINSSSTGVTISGNQGTNWSHRGYYNYGNGYCNQVSPKEYRRLTAQKEAFVEETKNLRHELSNKKQALKNELVKERPDIAKASELQKNISNLQAQIDQKRLEHKVELKKNSIDIKDKNLENVIGYASYSGGYCVR
jgi:hypothetical protein